MRNEYLKSWIPPSAITDQDGVRELPQIQGDVVFDKVTFSYDGTAKILNQVSFHINPGETIALVGPTGAGKTTIVNLISRFYDIQEGHVYIDGYDVREVSIESLRHQMGIMTQDNFLFSGTIKDNIRYGKLDATDEEIIAAAKAVNAHDFIMKLDKGYDTLLSERGGGLSIGQKQLLAFARTMVSDPRILILDEATSSIDTKTELLVQSGIENLLKGRTSFVIAHRLSTIQKADRIFVIDNGTIVEEGNAASLMARKGGLLSAIYEPVQKCYLAGKHNMCPPAHKKAAFCHFIRPKAAFSFFSDSVLIPFFHPYLQFGDKFLRFHCVSVINRIQLQNIPRYL